MPELDFALLGDFVRAEGGIAHVIAGGIDTIRAPTVPTGQNIGLVFRVMFTRNECGRPHRLELDLEQRRVKRLAELRRGADQLGVMAARGADPARASLDELDWNDPNAAVTRLDMSQSVRQRKAEGEVFGDIVDGAVTRPFDDGWGSINWRRGR